MKMNLFKNRRFKHGSLATIVAVGFIALVVVANVIVTMVTERYPMTIDLTENNLFSLSDESVAFVEGLNRDVEIIFCTNETDFQNLGGEQAKQVTEIVNGYAKYSSRISVQFIDIIKDPGFAQQYPDETINPYDIIVKSDLRMKKFNANEVIGSQQTTEGGTIYASNAEQNMTSAIMYVTDENPTKALVLNTMSQVDVTGYKTLLEYNNYTVDEISFVNEEIDPEVSLVILPQPASDLTAEQADKLDAFLDNEGKNGKNLVFVPSMLSPAGPVLKNFLAQWGIEIGTEFIAETETGRVFSGDAGIFINQIIDEIILGEMSNLRLPLVTSRAQPINILFETSGYRTVRPISTSFDTTILYPADAPDDFDPDAQPKSAFNTIVVSTDSKYEGNEELVSNVVALSTGAIVESSIMSYGGYANGDLMLTLTNNIVGKNDAVNILPVQFNSSTITITQAQITGFTIVLVWVVPIVMIGLGFLIFFRRRHL